MIFKLVLEKKKTWMKATWIFQLHKTLKGFYFCVGGSLLQSCHLKLYQSEDSTVFNYADFQSKITFSCMKM